MKKYCTIIFFTIILAFRFYSVSATPFDCAPKSNIENLPTDTTLIAELAAINLIQYQGQPVDTLLAHLPPGYIIMKIGGWRSQRLAEVLYVIYPNKISVGIHVRNFQYMNPHLVDSPNPKQNWSIPLFRKEAITYTIIYNNTTCINGCENSLK